MMTDDRQADSQLYHEAHDLARRALVRFEAIADRPSPEAERLRV